MWQWLSTAYFACLCDHYRFDISDMSIFFPNILFAADLTAHVFCYVRHVQRIEIISQSLVTSRLRGSKLFIDAVYKHTSRILIVHLLAMVSNVYTVNGLICAEVLLVQSP